MALVLFVLCSVFCVVFKAGQSAVPDGYILEVSHDCGTFNHGIVDGYGATVTIKSDLHVKAIIQCANRFKVQMTPIDDTNTLSMHRLYYTGDKNGTEKTDCFFKRPQKQSGLYYVEVDVYWGFSEGTIMNDYEAYTITCTAEKHASDTLSAKGVNNDAIAIKEDLQQNLGPEYKGNKALKLVDVLGNQITDSSIPMSKKVKLQLSISGGPENGLTPYNCVAKNSDNSKSYKILNAGCGDGVIFPKNQGFTTTATATESPFFKVFQLIETFSNPAKISYTCEFATCQNKCDGSSCAFRRKRSLQNLTERGSVSTRQFNLENFNRRLGQSETAVKDLKVQGQITTLTIALYGIGGISIISIIIALRSCLLQRYNAPLNQFACLVKV